jgi:hypothetical protein
MWAVCNNKCQESTESRAHKPPEDSLCEGPAAGAGNWTATSTGVFLCIPHHTAVCAPSSARAPHPCPTCPLPCHHVCSQTHHTHSAPTPCPYSPSSCSSPGPYTTIATSWSSPGKAGSRIKQVWVSPCCSRSTTPATATWDTPAPAHACTHDPVLTTPVSIPACNGSGSKWKELSGGCSGESRGAAKASSRPPATVPARHDTLTTALPLSLSPPFPK